MKGSAAIVRWCELREVYRIGGGIPVPPCASLEGGFLQGIVCALEHLVPFNPAILIGSPAGGQDGDPDGIPLTLSEGNGHRCGFVHRSAVWCGIPLPLVPILSDRWGDCSPLGGRFSDRHNDINLTLWRVSYCNLRTGVVNDGHGLQRPIHYLSVEFHALTAQTVCHRNSVNHHDQLLNLQRLHHPQS